jgi:hypothetical protein
VLKQQLHKLLSAHINYPIDCYVIKNFSDELFDDDTFRQHMIFNGCALRLFVDSPQYKQKQKQKQLRKQHGNPTIGVGMGPLSSMTGPQPPVIGMVPQLPQQGHIDASNQSNQSPSAQTNNSNPSNTTVNENTHNNNNNNHTSSTDQSDSNASSSHSSMHNSDPSTYPHRHQLSSQPHPPPPFYHHPPPGSEPHYHSPHHHHHGHHMHPHHTHPHPHPHAHSHSHNHHHNYHNNHRSGHSMRHHGKVGIASSNNTNGMIRLFVHTPLNHPYSQITIAAHPNETIAIFKARILEQIPYDIYRDGATLFDISGDERYNMVQLYEHYTIASTQLQDSSAVRLVLADPPTSPIPPQSPQ